MSDVVSVSFVRFIVIAPLVLSVSFSLARMCNTYTRIISLIRRRTTHDECVRLRSSSVLEHRSRIRHSRIRVRVRVHEGVRPCLGLPRVNEYAAVAGWLVKTVALLAYPFLPPPPSSRPPGPLWSSSYPLTRPPRDSQTPGDSQPPCPPLRPTPRPSARRFFPRFPYLSDIPLPASTRVDVRLIRLKSRREATNYYAS